MTNFLFTVSPFGSRTRRKAGTRQLDESIRWFRNRRTVGRDDLYAHPSGAIVDDRLTWIIKSRTSFAGPKVVSDGNVAVGPVSHRRVTTPCRLSRMAASRQLNLTFSRKRHNPGQTPRNGG